MCVQLQNNFHKIKQTEQNQKTKGKTRERNERAKNKIQYNLFNLLMLKTQITVYAANGKKKIVIKMK